MRERDTNGEFAQSPRECLFEAMYGYPLRLAEQVIAQGMLSPDLDEQFVAFHVHRVETIDQLLKDMEGHE